MEGIIIFIIIAFAASYLLYQKIATHKQKCSTCSETSCTTCPIAAMPTLKAHLEARKTPLPE